MISRQRALEMAESELRNISQVYGSTVAEKVAAARAWMDLAAMVADPDALNVGPRVCSVESAQLSAGFVRLLAQLVSEPREE